MDKRTRDLLISFLDLYLTDAVGGNVYGTICRCLEIMTLTKFNDSSSYNYWYVFRDEEDLYGQEIKGLDPTYKTVDLTCSCRDFENITFRRYHLENFPQVDPFKELSADLNMLGSVLTLSVFITDKNQFKTFTNSKHDQKALAPSDAKYARLKLDAVTLHWYHTSREYKALLTLSEAFDLNTFRVVFQVYDPHESQYAYRGLSNYKKELLKKINLIFPKGANIDHWEKLSQSGYPDKKGKKLIPILIKRKQPIIAQEKGFTVSLDELQKKIKSKKNQDVEPLDQFEIALLSDHPSDTNKKIIEKYNHFFMIPLFCNGQARGTAAIFWTTKIIKDPNYFAHAIKYLWPSIGREASQWFELAYEEIFEARLEEYAHDLNESNANNMMKGLLKHINCILNCTEGYVYQVNDGIMESKFHFEREGTVWKDTTENTGKKKKVNLADKKCKYNQSCIIVDDNSHVKVHCCDNEILMIYVVLEEKKKFILNLRCPDLLQHVFNSYSGALTNRLWTTIHRLEEIRKLHQARRNMAAAAIMSRNGSHNIGSHVLAALTHAIDVRPSDRQLYSYIQHRMDYLATITTDWPVWAPGARFKDEIMREFGAQTRLLSNICAAENITLDKIKFETEVRKLGSDNYDSGEDLYVPVPGGIVGRHAFYTIFENIIRNTAKHQESNVDVDDRQLIIRIQLIENQESIEFIIHDNVSTVKIRKEEDKAELPANISSMKEKDKVKLPLHQQLNDILEKHLIDEKGSIRKEGWGLAEMQMSTAYLKRQNGNNRLPTKLSSPITASFLNNTGKDRGTFPLTYTFSLPKVKDILVVGLEKPRSNAISSFNQQGIYFADDTDTLDICDYSIVILSERFKSRLDRLPYRHIIVSEDDSDASDCFIKNAEYMGYVVDSGSFKSKIYKRWLNYIKRIRNFPEGTARFKISIIPGTERALIGLSQYYDLSDFAWDNSRYREDIIRSSPIEWNNAEINELVSRRDNPFKVYNNSVNFNFTDALINAAENWLRPFAKSLTGSEQDQFKEHLKCYMNVMKSLFFEDASISASGDSIDKSGNAGSLGLALVKEDDTCEFSYIHHPQKPPVNSKYFEDLSGSQSYFSQLCRGDDDYDLKLLFYLAENAFLRVLIVDERVTQFVNTKQGMKEKLMHMQVFIPDKVSYHGRSRSLCRDHKTSDSPLCLESNDDKYDILIIHVGVIEKLTRVKNRKVFYRYLKH